MFKAVRETSVHAATGIECLRIGLHGRTNTAVYMFRRGRTLFDSGAPNQWPTIAAFLDAAKHAPEDLYLTHHHEDHAGNAARIAERYRTRVHAPAAALPLLARPPRIEVYRALVWGRPAAEAGSAAVHPAAAFGTDARPNTDGLTVVPVPAPGHSVDHTLLHVPELGALFTADIYVAPRPRCARYDEDVLLGLASLRAAAALPDVETLFCAHRGPLAHGQRLLAEKAAWLGELQAAAVERYEGRGEPLSAVAAALLGPEDALQYWGTGGDFSRGHLIRGLLEGRLRPGDGLDTQHRASERAAHWRAAAVAGPGPRAWPGGSEALAGRGASRLGHHAHKAPARPRGSG